MHHRSPPQRPPPLLEVPGTNSRPGLGTQVGAQRRLPHWIHHLRWGQSIKLVLWNIPICSMYGISKYIHPKNVPNVVKYSLHGAPGIVYEPQTFGHIEDQKNIETFFALSLRSCNGQHCKPLMIHQGHGIAWRLHAPLTEVSRLKST